MSDVSTMSSNDLSNDQKNEKADAVCQLVRANKLDYVTKIGGEELEDEDTLLDLEEEKYEEEVRLWLRKERALEVQE